MGDTRRKLTLEVGRDEIDKPRADTARRGRPDLTGGTLGPERLIVRAGELAPVDRDEPLCGHVLRVSDARNNRYSLWRRGVGASIRLVTHLHKHEHASKQERNRLQALLDEDAGTYPTDCAEAELVRGQIGVRGRVAGAYFGRGAG